MWKTGKKHKEGLIVQTIILLTCILLKHTSLVQSYFFWLESTTQSQ